ncbi:hypothetical protein WA026_018501 [Henosepilachna vigintioctopunctata]|uniref:Nucleoplasmin core domain-containing protein n=1 Tax=Henosepilachna vigintioctopunctata TaxID=420089 RepID=A0AAW1V278_9CUCU
MAEKYFYALTLKGAQSNELWDPEGKVTKDFNGGHKLLIKQALLGPEAIEGEVNVDQVEAMTWKDSVKIPVTTLLVVQIIKCSWIYLFLTPQLLFL